jgi:hypothetical protein
MATRFGLEMTRTTAWLRNTPLATRLGQRSGALAHSRYCWQIRRTDRFAATDLGHNARWTRIVVRIGWFYTLGWSPNCDQPSPKHLASSITLADQEFACVERPTTKGIRHALGAETPLLLMAELTR